MTAENNNSELKIGLALSGGGSRAIAFHLGCLRKLNDRQLLDHVKEISTVSGGSVLGAIYAYSNDSFEEFDKKIVNLLKEGFMYKIFEYLPTSKMPCLKKSIECNVKSAEIIMQVFDRRKKFWKLCCLDKIRFLMGTRFYCKYEKGKFNEAFERYLDKEIFYNKKLTHPTRNNVKISINAAELSTKTAMNFRPDKSCNSYFGKIDEPILVSKAVARSAAHPLFLPSSKENLSFTQNGTTKSEEIFISDGGVYDNTGTDDFFIQLNKSTKKISDANNENINCIIACLADPGIDTDDSALGFIIPRLKSAFLTPFTRSAIITPVQLDILNSSDKVYDTLMPHLGMEDVNDLKIRTFDLVERDKIKNHPTDFSAMNDEEIRQLSKRGEQITEYQLEFAKFNLLQKINQVAGLT